MNRLLVSLLVAGLALTGVEAQAQSNFDLSGRWRINGNNFPGDVVITQAADGTLSGSMYGDPISGYMAAGVRQAVILRGPRGAPGTPDQVYLATLAPDDRTMSGLFFALNTVNGGANAERNVFPFRAQRGTQATPASPGSPPYSGRGGPRRIVSSYQIDGNGYIGPLLVNSQGADGTIGGIVYTESIVGHYARATGTVAFLRMLNGSPFQVFVGTATGESPPRLSGTFYPLNAAGGATRQKIQYEWNTGDAPLLPNLIIVAPIGPGDVVRARRPLDCDGLVVRVYYADTGSHIDVSRGQTRAIRINQQPATIPMRAIRWECRNPGRAAEVSGTLCPGAPLTGGNSNIARVVRTNNGDTQLDCLFRPGL